MNILTAAQDKIIVLDATATTAYLQDHSSPIRDVLAVSILCYIHVINLCEVYAGFSVTMNDYEAISAVQVATASRAQSLILVYQSQEENFDAIAANYWQEGFGLHDAYCLATAGELAAQHGSEAVVLVTANPAFYDRAVQKNICSALLIPKVG